MVAGTRPSELAFKGLLIWEVVIAGTCVRCGEKEQRLENGATV